MNNKQKSSNDEKELDDIFSNDTKLAKTIKRAKRQSIVRNIIVSALVFAVLFIGSNVIFSELVYKMEGAVQISIKQFNNISSPNNYIGKVARYHDYLSGRSTFTTYKIIEGKVVYTGQQEYHYGVFSNHYGNLIGTESPSILGESWDEEDLKQRRFNELGQREMVFFYPYVNYNKTFNDLSLLDRISQDKYIEVALSFDQEYTIDQVKELIPQDVTLAWYWIDDIPLVKREELQAHVREQSHSNGETYIMHYPAKVRSERTAYGIKAYDQHGQFYDFPEEQFFRAIDQGRTKKSRYQWQFDQLYNTLADENGEMRRENLRVLGVVITGDIDSMMEIRELPFIRASSFGVIIDKI